MPLLSMEREDQSAILMDHRESKHSLSMIPLSVDDLSVREKMDKP